MGKSRAVYAFPAALFLAVTGCTRAPDAGANSQIVRQVEAAGSGPVESASRDSLFQWFQSSHKDLAITINKECASIRKTAPAAWGDTAEGKVCQAAHDLARFYDQP
jgi:hypothetical protein